MTTLSVSQLAAICTRTPKPPWHLKDLATVFTALEARPLSVRNTLDKFAASNILLYVEVRDMSLLEKASNLAELRAAWASSAPSKTTLVQLSRALSNVGASITFVSHDWQTVAIFGNCAKLASLNVLPIIEDDKISALSTAGSALATAGGIIIVVGGTTPASPVAVGVGVGVMIAGLGLLVLSAAIDTAQSLRSSGTPVAAPPASDTGLISIVGDQPTGAESNNPPTIAIDPSSLPSAPEDDPGSETDPGTTDTDPGTTDTDPGTTDTDPGTTDTDSGTSETGTSETGSSETGSSETGTSETGTSETGSSETGSSETGSSETGSSETGSSETGSSDGGSPPPPEGSDHGVTRP
jgi:hypothetical protein